jgi:hypothetical protein
MFIFEKKEARKIILIQSIVTLFFVLIVIIATSYISKKISAISSSLSEKRHTALILEASIQTLEQLKNDLALADDHGSRIENAFPSASNILPFITSLERGASAHNTQITADFDTPAAFVQQGQLTILKINYKAHISSTAADLTAFLQDFEHLPYYTKINSMIINGPSSGGINSLTDVNINADVYVRDN